MNYSKTRRLNYAIPDEDYKGVVDTIEISRKGKINAVTVSLDVAHSSPSDLAVELSGPGGKTITLDGPGKDAGRDLNKTYSGNALDGFQGSVSQGKWTIKVIDTSKQDTGTLKEWTLALDMDSAEKKEILTHNDYKLVSSHMCHVDYPIDAVNLSVVLSDDFDVTSKLSLESPEGTIIPLPFTKTNDTLYYDFHLNVVKGETPKGNWKLLLDSNAKGHLISWKLHIDTKQLVKVKNDDLTKIEGVGPKISEILQSKGIRTFETLANTDAAIIKSHLETAGPRYQMHDPTSWPRQSRLAADGNWNALEKLQDELDGGR